MSLPSLTTTSSNSVMPDSASQLTSRLATPNHAGTVKVSPVGAGGGFGAAVVLTELGAVVLLLEPPPEPDPLPVPVEPPEPEVELFFGVADEAFAEGDGLVEGPGENELVAVAVPSAPDWEGLRLVTILSPLLPPDALSVVHGATVKSVPAVPPRRSSRGSRR